MSDHITVIYQTEDDIAEAHEQHTPAFRAGVAIMDSIDPDLYRQLGELFGETPTETKGTESND